MRKSIIMIAAIMLMLTGCGDKSTDTSIMSDTNSRETVSENTILQESSENSYTSIQITELEKGFSYAEMKDDYAFDKFLSDGGAESDTEVISFLTKNLIGNTINGFGGENFGCSAVSAKSKDGYYFGRNFDWYNCNALVVAAYPDNGYSSISTVNLNFIGFGTSMHSDEILTTAAVYAPLDGMNEKGLCVSVNMVEDSEKVDQRTDLPDITTTTAIRLLLDKATDTNEAIALLQQYDMHASKGLTVHFAVSDSKGKCVAIEYLNNEMIVTETPVVTNFYFAEGEKNGIGTAQSHERYEKIMETLADTDTFTADDVMNALDSVSKHNYNDGETTEWSAVFNQSTGEAVYCHRENYDKQYTFQIQK